MVVAGRGELLPTATKAGEAWYLKLLPCSHLRKKVEEKLEEGRREASPVKPKDMRALWWSSWVVLVPPVPLSVA